MVRSCLPQCDRRSDRPSVPIRSASSRRAMTVSASTAPALWRTPAGTQIPLSAAQGARCDRSEQSLMVTLVLFGVRPREVAERLVEDVARAEIGPDGRGTPGPGVSPSQRPGTDTGVDPQDVWGSSSRRRRTPSSPRAGEHRSLDGYRPAGRLVAIRGRCRWRPASVAAPRRPFVHGLRRCSWR